MTTDTSEGVHRICLYVCTHKRNDKLTTMLGTVLAASRHAADVAQVGVVVIDDNPDGRAEEVTSTFEHDFPLGLHYRHCGAQNISAARNMGVEAAKDIGDWVAMTDDDIEVPPTWFAELVAVQRETDADCVTGPAYLTFPDDSPRWLRTQPFGEVGLFSHDELAVIGEGSTGNSMLRASFLRDHSDVRFEPELGTLGGEDMVFFRRAVDHGLVSVYSRRVAVTEPFVGERQTYGYHLYRSLWIGNTDYITNTSSGRASRGRVVARAVKRGALALARPVRRLADREAPQVHYAVALATQSVGMLLGAAGVKLPHR